MQAVARLGELVDEPGRGRGPPPTVATDDWPFLYLRNPGIAPYYLAALGVLFAFA